MPADYTSTARALSISTSPDPFSPSDEDDAHPPWGHNRNQSGNRHGHTRGPINSNLATSTRDQIVHRGSKDTPSSSRSMAADDFAAEDRGIGGFFGSGCVGFGVHVLHRPSV